MKLSYCIRKGNIFEPFMEYVSPINISEDEIMARQLCDYFIVKGKEYALYGTEWEDTFEDVILVDEKGIAPVFSEERKYGENAGLHIEVREYQEHGDMPLLKVLPCDNYVEVIRYLLKHVVKFNEYGYCDVVSREVDEDRSVFVLYVTKPSL